MLAPSSYLRGSSVKNLQIMDSRAETYVILKFVACIFSSEYDAVKMKERKRWGRESLKNETGYKLLK